MSARFAGWVAAVTGAAQGIGHATADLLVREGAFVYAADVQAEPLAVAVAAWGDAARAVPADVTRRDEVQALFEQVRQGHGHLDTLVANAGRSYALTSLNANEEDWQACLDLNLKSVWHCARAAHPLLRRSGRASIVTVASAHGLRASRTSFPYSAAKGGLLALTRSLAVEYAPHIRVNGIVPGQVESVRTEPYFASFRDPAKARRRVLSTFPMGRLGKPEDIARAILFLASTDASWITGTFLTVDGGRDAALLDLSDLKEPG